MVSFSGRLRLKRACDYTYLNQSDCLEIHGVDDDQDFSTLMVMYQNQQKCCVWDSPLTSLAIFLPLTNPSWFLFEEFRIILFGKEF